MRIAIVDRKKCNPRRCSLECYKFCPRNRMGEKCIEESPSDKKPDISEELCVGCGICVHKCPFDAIHIINLADELGKEIIHSFGKNAFHLYRLPTPIAGRVVGLLGPNGIGKTTIFNILSGTLQPNFGDLENPGNLEQTMENFRGSELFNYFENFLGKEFVTSIKPQYVDSLPKVAKGKVSELLKKIIDANPNPDRDRVQDIVQRLQIEGVLNRDISKLSGGELQRTAIAASIIKEADIYFFDEPSSYLDIYQRMNMARIIRELAETKPTVVIEHDLAILDFLTDTTHIMYGTPGAYGVVAQPRTTRHAINIYLGGYLEKENIRFRDYDIKFELHPPRKEWQSYTLLRFPELYKKYPNFSLRSTKGEVHMGEVIGVVGPNATGKTTFVSMLAGELEPDEGYVEEGIKVSYKPQYIKPDSGLRVIDKFMIEAKESWDDPVFKAEVKHPLRLPDLENSLMETLSGGELQRVAVGLCLAKKADIYLLDEPSAYLDSNQRMETAKVLRRFIEKSKKSAMVVDHDVYFIDIVSDTIMVFAGEPGKEGTAAGPYALRDGMNRFLTDIEVTFRRDPDSKRPRINKIDSRLDREQKSSGDYYYQ